MSAYVVNRIWAVNNDQAPICLVSVVVGKCGYITVCFTLVCAVPNLHSFLTLVLVSSFDDKQSLSSPLLGNSSSNPPLALQGKPSHIFLLFPTLRYSFSHLVASCSHSLSLTISTFLASFQFSEPKNKLLQKNLKSRVENVTEKKHHQ